LLRILVASLLVLAAQSIDADVHLDDYSLSASFLSRPFLALFFAFVSTCAAGAYKYFVTGQGFLFYFCSYATALSLGGLSLSHFVAANLSDMPVRVGALLLAELACASFLFIFIAQTFLSNSQRRR
jgi:hypothetical protein